MFYANRSSVHARECCVCRVVVLSRSLALARCPLLPRRWQCETGNYRLASTAVWVAGWGRTVAKNSLFLKKKKKGKRQNQPWSCQAQPNGVCLGSGASASVAGPLQPRPSGCARCGELPSRPRTSHVVYQTVYYLVDTLRASYSIDACSRHQSSSGPNTSSPTQPLVHHDKDSTRTCELTPRTGIRSINSTAESGV